jgi:hypothetical protein
VQHYNPKALLKKWEQMHISVWNGMLGMAEASHKRAVARCIHGPLGKDIGRKSFSLSLSRTRTLDKDDPRCTFPHHADNVLAVTVMNKDSSETVRHRSKKNTISIDCTNFATLPNSHCVSSRSSCFRSATHNRLKLLPRYSPHQVQPRCRIKLLPLRVGAEVSGTQLLVCDSSCRD